MIRIKVACISFLILCSTLLQAQTRTQTNNTNAWLMYFGNHKISNRLGLHAEVQWRRSEVFAERQQLLLRTGIDYYVKPDVRFTAGYAFVETYPYGEFAVPNSFPEHRIWQQALVQQTFKYLNLTHRYRLEQRFIGNASTGEFKGGRYENRIRYMAKATRNITKAKHPLFVAMYDEIFVNFGKDVGYNIFDQNRLYGAVGYTISSAFKIELGYLYQVVLLRSLDAASRNRVENNHTLQIGIFSNISFVKRGGD